MNIYIVIYMFWSKAFNYKKLSCMQKNYMKLEDYIPCMSPKYPTINIFKTKAMNNYYCLVN